MSRSLGDREGSMAARATAGDAGTDEGSRLLRIVRRTSGSVVTWRRAQTVLLSAIYTRPRAVRDLVGALDVGRDRLYGHVKHKKRRVEFLAFCR
jgi:hypothetical protein